MKRVSTPSPNAVIFLSDGSRPGPQFRLAYELKDQIMHGSRTENSKCECPGNKIGNRTLSGVGRSFSRSCAKSQKHLQALNRLGEACAAGLGLIDIRERAGISRQRRKPRGPAPKRFDLANLREIGGDPGETLTGSRLSSKARASSLSITRRSPSRLA